jgi:hypothetical protein
LSNTSDVDYWSFDAQAGDRLVLGVEVPGRPNASQLYYLIEAADGQDLLSFYPDYTGWGQSGVVTIPGTAPTWCASVTTMTTAVSTGSAPC